MEFMKTVEQEKLNDTHIIYICLFAILNEFVAMELLLEGFYGRSKNNKNKYRCFLISCKRQACCMYYARGVLV